MIVQPVIGTTYYRDYYKAVIEHPISFSSSPTLDTVTWTGDVISEMSDEDMATYDDDKVEYDNAHGEIGMEVRGLRFFCFFGYNKSFPAGTYTAVVEAMYSFVVVFYSCCL